MNSSKDSDGNSTRGHRKATKSEEERAHVPRTGGGWPQIDEATMTATGFVFLDFLHRSGGYLKVKRDVDGYNLHLTWTWITGKWQRYYVYVRIEYYCVGLGLSILAEKIDSVESGESVPTPDRFSY